MESTATEQKKVTPNEAIIQMISAINVGATDRFYHWAELYRDGVPAGGDIRHKVTNILKQKPMKMMRLDDLDRGIKSLISIAETKEVNAFLSPDARQLIDGLLKEWENAEVYRYHNLGVRNKILLYGPTGNGKTTIARLIANESGLPFVEVNSDSIIDSHLGATGGNINKLFNGLHQACVLFWDEVDGIGKKRGSTDNSSGSTENDRMVNSILVNIEKMGRDVIFIGATNRIETMDTAFIRRFDELVEIAPPTQQQKIEYAEQLSEYYKIPGCTIGPNEMAGCENYSQIKMIFVKAARNYVINKIS